MLTYFESCTYFHFLAIQNFWGKLQNLKVEFGVYSQDTCAKIYPKIFYLLFDYVLGYFTSLFGVFTGMPSKMSSCADIRNRKKIKFSV